MNEFRFLEMRILILDFAQINSVDLLRKHCVYLSSVYLTDDIVVFLNTRYNGIYRCIRELNER